MKLREQIENHPRVRALREEPSEDARWWVYFKKGWQAGCGGLHMDTATTLTECLKRVREASPCSCGDCRREN